MKNPIMLSKYISYVYLKEENNKTPTARQPIELKQFCYQNDHWKKRMEAGISLKSVSIIDFLENLVMGFAFLCIINAR